MSAYHISTARCLSDNINDWTGLSLGKCITDELDRQHWRKEVGNEDELVYFSCQETVQYFIIERYKCWFNVTFQMYAVLLYVDR